MSCGLAMSDTDFSASTTSSSWDYDEVIKPPKWILPVGIASVSLGAIWSVVCLLIVEGFFSVGDFKPGFAAGIVGYLLTLTVPSFLIVGLRRFKIKKSKESPGSYDSYAGVQMENRLKFLAITGLLFSLVAIYVAVLPYAERGA
jgi:hypothetical protein